MCPCSKVKTVFGREFKSYFDSPVAYVFLTAFLVLIGFLTFGVAMFYERRQADLTPFFFWHPWVYLLLVPAATMGLWAEERRNGTIELLLIGLVKPDIIPGVVRAEKALKGHPPAGHILIVEHTDPSLSGLAGIIVYAPAPPDK